MGLLHAPKWREARYSKSLDDFTNGSFGFANIRFKFPADTRYPTLPVRSNMAASPTCREHFALSRSEAARTEAQSAVVAYHRQCVATNVETGACTNEITVPDYGVTQGTISTGVLGALKILNKDRSAVTITELVINHREAPGCHWNGNRTLLQGDVMTLNSAECGDIINVHIKTANSACDFGW